MREIKLPPPTNQPVQRWGKKDVAYWDEAAVRAAIQDNRAELETENLQLWETLIKLADYLQIDAQTARAAPGKPSDVFIAAIEKRKNQDQSVESTEKVHKGDIVGWLRRRSKGQFCAMTSKLAAEIADHIQALQDEVARLARTSTQADGQPDEFSSDAFSSRLEDRSVRGAGHA